MAWLIEDEREIRKITQWWSVAHDTWVVRSVPEVGIQTSLRFANLLQLDAFLQMKTILIYENWGSNNIGLNIILTVFSQVIANCI